MPHNNITTTPRGYPLPHPEHIAIEDVMAIAMAFTLIDTEVSQLEEHLAILRLEQLLEL